MTSEKDEEILKFIRNLKCIKCESTDNLMPFPLTKVYQSTRKTGGMPVGQKITTTWTYSSVVPTCNECFSKHRKLRLIKYTIMGAILIVVISILLTFLMGYLSGQGLGVPSTLIPLYFGIVITGIVSIYIINYGLNKHNNNIKSHAKLNPIWNQETGKREAIVYIKPQDSADWVLYNDWINATLRDRIGR